MDTDSCLELSLGMAEWFGNDYLDNITAAALKVDALFKLNTRLDGSVHTVADLGVR